MARHSKDDKKTQSDIDKMRKEILKRFFGMSAKMEEHILWSAKATKHCQACSKDKTTGQHLPGKAVDEAGLCAFCHGTYLVPDTDQRNWAAERIGAQVAPPQKSVEMTIDQTVTTGELAEKAEKLTDDELKKAAETLKSLGLGE